ncbi:MAG TPA: hypothetical protein VKA60_11190 [Blastocatellia bacterium]|nr:hypothetical protein [Blastocatellia bacterium]
MLKRSFARGLTLVLRVALVTLVFAASGAAQIQFSKPKTVKPLPNPSMMSATRDEAVTIIKQMLETREIPLDKEDCNSTTGECTLISKPVIFIKGIPTKSQLQHFTELSDRDVRNWSRGRYVLRFQVTPATPRTAQVGAYARFDGLTDGAAGQEWVQLQSRGELEDLMLRCIQDRIAGGDCKDIFK